jgi:hypothetical protein
MFLVPVLVRSADTHRMIHSDALIEAASCQQKKEQYEKLQLSMKLYSTAVYTIG